MKELAGVMVFAACLGYGLVAILTYVTETSLLAEPKISKQIGGSKALSDQKDRYENIWVEAHLRDKR